MIAVDTNVLVRYLTGDHPAQSARARTLVDRNHVFVPVTVLLETEWVLRAVYGLASSRISKLLRAFAGLPRVFVEDEALAAQALDHMDAGIDFADALHLARSGGCDAFFSFDGRLQRSAKQIASVAVRDP